MRYAKINVFIYLHLIFTSFEASTNSNAVHAKHEKTDHQGTLKSTTRLATLRIKSKTIIHLYGTSYLIKSFKRFFKIKFL